MGLVEDKDRVSIRDQLGNQPDVTTFGVWEYTETFRIYPLPDVIGGANLGNAWIVGSPLNGIVGTNTDTAGGGQQVVGDGGRTTTLLRVVCPNDIFYDFIRDTVLWDTTNSTATINTSTHAITFTDGQIAYVKLHNNSNTVYNATVEKVGNVTGTLVYALSADDKAHWQTATLNTPLTFTNTGTVLWLKITSTGASTLAVDSADGRSTPVLVRFNQD